VDSDPKLLEQDVSTVIVKDLRQYFCPVHRLPSLKRFIVSLAMTGICLYGFLHVPEMADS